MNEKLSFQNITELLAQKAGVQKKVAETFTKGFFDTIIEALYMGEDTIKVKGLGTFKLVEVGSRESVNVSNGERIVIPGYKKVSFAPEDSVVEFLNQNDTADAQSDSIVETESIGIGMAGTEPIEIGRIEAEPVKESGEVTDVVHEALPAIETHEEPEVIEVVDEQHEPEKPTAEKAQDLTADATQNIDNILQTAVPELVEIPQDEFAGIDMLISTPESVDEVRQQLSDATAKMDEAIEVARKAVEEKLRLQKLLERLETNVVPESMETDAVPENVETYVVPENVEIGIISKEEEVSATDEISLNEMPSVTDENEDASQSSSNKVEEDEKSEALERILQVKDEDEDKESKKKKSSGMAWFISFAVILLAVIIFFLYRTFVSIDAVKDIAPIKLEVQKENEAVKPQDEPHKTIREKQPAKKSDAPEVEEAITISVNSSSQTDETQQPTSSVVKDTEPSRPSVYIMQKGESLTRISQKFYGTKDSVRAIIRVNDFVDPNNIPIGAKIKLP